MTEHSLSWRETDWTKYLGALAPSFLILGALIYSTGYLAMLSAASWLGVGPLEINRESAIPVGIIVLVATGSVMGASALVTSRIRSRSELVWCVLVALIIQGLLISSEYQVEGSITGDLIGSVLTVTLISILFGILLARWTTSVKDGSLNAGAFVAIVLLMLPILATIFGNAFPTACLSPGSIFGKSSRSRFAVTLQDAKGGSIAEGILVYEDTNWVVLELGRGSQRHCEKVAKSSIGKIVGSPFDNAE